MTQMIGELFAVWCDLLTIISVRGAKAPGCAVIQKPRCGATVCVQRKSLCVHFDATRSTAVVDVARAVMVVCIFLFC